MTESTPPRYDVVEGKDSEARVIQEALTFEQARSLLPLPLGQWLRVNPRWRP